MLIIGCFMDATPAAIIMVPIFQPIAARMGFNGIHFGLVMVLTFIMAGITPPVGVTLFVTSAVAKLRFSEFLKEMWPFIIISTGVLFLIAYVPDISLWLPNLIG
jgi:TRAP-type C4-dicarboxylate transport system permease large subunit